MLPAWQMQGMAELLVGHQLHIRVSKLPVTVQYYDGLCEILCSGMVW